MSVWSQAEQHGVEDGSFSEFRDDLVLVVRCTFIGGERGINGDDGHVWEAFLDEAVVRICVVERDDALISEKNCPLVQR